MLFNSKKGVTFTERATIALSGIQRDAYAMDLLRTKLEARLKACPKPPSAGDDLLRLLDLIRTGEASLNDLAGRVESARFLEEFVAIISSAAASVSEVKKDMEKLVPAAEKSLEDLLNAIASCSLASSTDQERQGLMAEAADAAACNTGAVTIQKDHCVSQIEERSELPA